MSVSGPYEFEHGIDILGWDGYTIILDVEEAMSRGGIEYLLGDIVGWIGNVNYWD